MSRIIPQLFYRLGQHGAQGAKRRSQVRHTSKSHFPRRTFEQLESRQMLAALVHLIGADDIKVEEGGATGSYEVVLTSLPAEDVTVTLNSDEQLTAVDRDNPDNAFLTFKRDTYDVPQKVLVTAVDDLEVEGAHVGKVSHTVKDAEDVVLSVNIKDNDSKEVPVNDQPIADPQGVSTAEGTPLPIALTGDDADSDVPQTLTFAVVTGPEHGTLDGPDPTIGVVTYTPNPGYNGPDSFTFTVTDDDTAGDPANLTSEPATVSINVTPVTPVNAQPIANDDPNVSTPEGTAVPIALTGDDGDPEVPQTLTFTLGTGPSNGELSGFDPNTGAVTYTPDGNYNGPDSFTFTVTDDGTAGDPANLTSTEATVSITVAPVNAPPVANGQEDITTPADTSVVITLDVDDGDPEVDQSFTFSLVAGPSNGELNGFDPATGTVTYTPNDAYNGPDSFTYTVTDDATAGDPANLTSETATVNVDVLELLTLQIDDVSLVEGDSDTTAFTFTVSLSQTSSQDVTVQYATADGTAAQPGDYTSTSGTATILAGQLSTPILVSVNGDTTVEPDDTFFVNLSQPSGATIASNQGQGTILNDDWDFGQLDFAELNGLVLPAGELRYELEATHDGLLTLEAAFAGSADSIELTLLDADGNSVASSALVNGKHRIDWAVSAGQSYSVVVTGTNDHVDLTIANLVHRDGTTLTVSGTDGEDTFEFSDAASIDVTINGVGYHFEDGEVEAVIFNGGAGDDIANLTSTSPTANDSAELWPDHGTFTIPGTTVTLTGIESINIDGRGGEDTVIVHDSAGDDGLIAHAATSAEPVSSITVADHDDDDPAFTPTYSHSLANFEILTAQSTDGADWAKFYDSDGDDEFIAKQFETVLSGDGFNFRAENFQNTHGYAKSGGDDRAELYDTSRNDRFKGYPEVARMFKGAFQRRAKFFDTVVAYATAGGRDEARLFGSAGTDQLIASPTETRLYSDDAGHELYDLTVASFDEVLIRASDGFDTGTFTGGPGDDLVRFKWLRHTMEVSPKTEMMNRDIVDGKVSEGDVYKITARGFDSTALDGLGGFDLVKFWNTQEDDRFVVGGNRAAMYSPENELLYEAIAFEKVRFNHVYGGNDTTEKVSPIDFVLAEYWPPEAP